jgi:hypothetical protein
MVKNGYPDQCKGKKDEFPAYPYKGWNFTIGGHHGLAEKQKQ